MLILDSPFRIALGHAQDPALIKETFEYLMSSARDQDFTYWLRGLSTNPKSRRQVAQFFKDEYQVVSAFQDAVGAELTRCRSTNVSN